LIETETFSMVRAPSAMEFARVSVLPVLE